MTEIESTGNQAKRMAWLDNLRTFMIFLVVLAHATVVYEKYSMGKNWWIVVDPAANDVPGILFLILNIFVIATIFFVSGFLVPPSLKAKSNRAFVAAKVKRLMVPWAVAILVLIPLYKMIFLASRGLPQESWTTYFHWQVIWSQNWLWFLPVLFLFDILYLGLSKLPVNVSWISMKRGLWLALIVGFLYAFCMDFFGLHGWTKTPVLDFQNERLLIYFIAYLLGALAFERKVLEGDDWKNKKLDIILHSTGWIPINLYLFMLIYSLIMPDKPLLSEAVDTLILRLSFVVALAYLIYAMVATFKRFFNKQRALGAELSANSYTLYIIHVVVLGALAMGMQNTGLPSLIKLSVVVVATYILCNALVSTSRRAKKLAGL